MLPMAWRNLWRNPRRTWLSSGAIAFAVTLLVFFMALQVGQYAAMVDGGTSLLSGHVQVQRQGYADDPRLETSISRAASLRDAVAAVPGVVAVGRRAQAFALASFGERSFAAHLLGVEPALERELVRLPHMLSSGRYLSADDPTSGVGEAVLGVALAHNLGVGVGDELTLLGNAAEGGVAAAAVEVVGIFDAGNDDLNRTVVQIPYAVFADAFGLVDEAHALIVRAIDAPSSVELAAHIAQVVPPGIDVLTWRDLMPELEQMIDLDRSTGYFFYAVVSVMVTFSIVNTFVMTVFERTREFGMLMALGMRARALIGLLQLEALGLVLLGIGIGLAVALVTVGWLANVGFPLPGDAERMLQKLHLPTRIFPVLNLVSLATAPVVLLIAVQLAALVPSLRVRRLVPVVALRAV